MRLLAIHLDRFSCEATHTVDESEGAARDPPDALAFEGCVGAFLGIEARDGGRIEGVVETAAAELRDASEQLNENSIAVVPCPHLIDAPASHEVAQAVVSKLSTALGDDRTVRAAPVGWHLALDVDAKGHPFSVRSRRITGRERAEDGDRERRWFVATSDGNSLVVSPIEDTNLSPAQRDVVESTRRERTYRAERDADVLCEHGFATRNDTTGDTDLRWNPRGVTLRTIARAMLDQRLDAVGGTPVETPGTYGTDVEAIREHVAATADRAVTTGGSARGRVFRTALCPGHLSVLRDASLSAPALPATVHETGTCKRSTPDGVTTETLAESHTATADLDGAKAILEERMELAASLGDVFGIERVPVVRVTEAFYADEREWVRTLLVGREQPTLIERVPDSGGTWELSVEFMSTGSNGVRELGWVRLDRDGSERFGIEYADGEELVVPPIVHCAPVGTIESLLAAVLDRGVPTWLAPTQVRLVPVGDRHTERCRAVAETLADTDVRVDLDDRELTVGERIAAADDDHVPYYAVVGDRDVVDGDPEAMVGDRENAEELRVTDREGGRTEETTAAALAERIGAATPLDRPVSRRGPLCLSNELVFDRSE